MCWHDEATRSKLMKTWISGWIGWSHQANKRTPTEKRDNKEQRTETNWNIYIYNKNHINSRWREQLLTKLIRSWHLTFTCQFISTDSSPGQLVCFDNTFLNQRENYNWLKIEHHSPVRGGLSESTGCSCGECDSRAPIGRCLSGVINITQRCDLVCMLSRYWGLKNVSSHSCVVWVPSCRNTRLMFCPEVPRSFFENVDQPWSGLTPH